MHVNGAEQFATIVLPSCSSKTYLSASVLSSLCVMASMS